MLQFGSLAHDCTNVDRQVFLQDGLVIHDAVALNTNVTIGKSGSCGPTSQRPNSYISFDLEYVIG